MKLHVRLHQFFEEVRLIRQLLESHFVMIESNGNTLKNHVEVEWVVDFLGISLSTFYRHVKGRLLRPVFKAGRRELYSKREVLDLFSRGQEGFTPYRDLQSHRSHSSMYEGVSKGLSF